ncbi:hypothetical protein IE3_03222 [Bacillus cereus BAG3X2-1]|uniref:Phage protein n=1 Tax=Bacillus tropicus TaxID=2026188 RepID=A0ABD7ZJY6_9BACI|nr:MULTISPECIES: hypothetical protein [Bacillus cereus group]EJQ11761.1 hypothetical protein IE3_03222 [Bacillus cereus BAG3X2-1]KMQ18035.1 hypothetical protein TU70_11640 [Bacillus mycoides]WMY13516.1 hypothetical protein P3F89_16200 [Bacillus tropicus]
MQINEIISLIAMIATVISTVIAILQTKKCNDIKKEIINIKSETYNLVKNSDKSQTQITNSGKNSGVISEKVEGGVHLGR